MFYWAGFLFSPETFLYSIGISSFVKCVFFLLLWILSIPTCVFAAQAEPSSFVFSQEVIGVSPGGLSYAPIRLRSESFRGMKTLRFDLGRGQVLEVRTNLVDPQGRGVSEVAEVLRRCYAYLEGFTGRILRHGVLLYLVEMEKMPPSYVFEAGFGSDSRWSEVRLCLLSPGESLGASESLAELLYDTLPHELGHDLLGSLGCLPHDVEDQPSYYTRWFIEGICEMLAKGFARLEHCPQRLSYLGFRRVDSVLDDAQVRQELFFWAQDNDNQLALESDLYGAAMLVVMTWTERVGLADLLGSFQRRGRPLSGADLVSTLERQTGLSRIQAMDRAAQIGRQLKYDDYYSGWFLPRPLARNAQKVHPGT